MQQQQINKQNFFFFKSRDVRCFYSQFRVNYLINFLLYASNQTGHYTVISGPVPKNEFRELTSCSVNWSDTTGESEKCPIIQCKVPLRNCVRIVVHTKLCHDTEVAGALACVFVVVCLFLFKKKRQSFSLFLSLQSR